MRLILAVLLVAFATSGCFLGSYQGEIAADPDTVKKKMTEVIEDVGWSYDYAVGEATVTAYLDFGPFGRIALKSGSVYDADLVVFHEEDILEVERRGAISLTPSENGTHYEGIFATDVDDPHADAHLILELTRQRIALDEGAMQPFTNPRKSGWTYTGLNTISPIISGRYLAKDNPWLSSHMRGHFHLQNAIGDIGMGALLLSSLLVDDRETKNDLVVAGITVGAFWRLFTLLHLVDVNNYNRLAQTPYNLKRAVLTE
jgi:hypothetical protein